jgi:hypothetical protein
MFSDEGGVGTTSSLKVRRARSRRGTFVGAWGAAFLRLFRAVALFARLAGVFLPFGRLAERRAAVRFRLPAADLRAVRRFGLAIAPVLSEP